jgi:spore maturation protein CgeB
MLNLVLFTRSDLQISSRAHTLFLEGLGEYFNLTVIRSPGHRVTIRQDEVIERYSPDVVVCHAHSKYMNGYFEKFRCLKVMVAADFFKVITKNKEDFYKNNRFDIVFQRRFIDFSYLNIKELPIFSAQSVYLPWCADENEFYPDFNEWDSRINKIGVAACYQAPFYSERKLALEELNKYDFVRNGKNEKIDFSKSEYKPIGSEYGKFLRSYLANLSSAEDNSVFGRVFESMASGCVVLTPSFGSIDILFPQKPLILYKKDLSDIRKKAESILNNKEEMKEMSKTAYDVYVKNHTNKIRIKEMSDNIKRFLSGQNLERKWGQ